MAISGPSRLAARPAWRFSASFGRAGRRANLGKKIAKASKHPPRRLTPLWLLPGKRLVFDGLAGKKERPVCRVHQTGPSLGGIYRREHRQSPVKLLLAKAEGRFNRLALLLIAPELVYRP